MTLSNLDAIAALEERYRNLDLEVLGIQAEAVALERSAAAGNLTLAEYREFEKRHAAANCELKNILEALEKIMESIR